MSGKMWWQKKESRRFERGVHLLLDSGAGVHRLLDGGAEGRCLQSLTHQFLAGSVEVIIAGCL